MKATIKKPRKCRNRACRAIFTPSRPLQTVCGPLCAFDLIEQRKAKQAEQQAKVERQQIKARKEALKSISKIANEVQKVFNNYIRERDKRAGYGCISCGTKKPDIQYAAGHYRSRGANSWLRFNEDNVFLQCNKRCNSELGSNSRMMRIGMIHRIGQERFDAVDNDNTVHKWTREELRAIEAKYKSKLKELTK